MKKCAIIINPHSGKGIKKKMLKKVEEILFENGYIPKVYITRYPGHAKNIVSGIDYADLVISFGGDGTFNEVVSGNFKRKDRLVLSHIPLGTTNDIGKMFGLNKNLLSNLKLILDGKIRDIDICEINGQPFVYVAGFGKFLNVPYETPRGLKKKVGYIAYIFKGIKNFFDRTNLIELEYTVDGQTKPALYSFMIITNATRIAGINNIYDNIKLDDGKFEVLCSNFTSKKDIVKGLYYLTRGQISGFETFQADNLKIKFHENLKKPWCIDGEELKQSKTREYKIQMLKDMKMLLPKDTQKLFIKK